MKKRVLSILTFFAAVTLSAQTSIPNGGFETWNTITWEDPMYYMSSNLQNMELYGAPPNVTKTSGAYHGSYAVQLTGMLYKTDTLVAYFINGQPNGPAVSGGIPYNQKASGIRLYYKYTTTAKDSALVFLAFKSAGTVIGEYAFSIAKTASSYTLWTQSFSLPKTPDTVVFGAATSYNVINGGSGLPGSVLTIDSVNFTGVASQPADLNGDFETWQDDTTYTLAGWNTDGSGIEARTTDSYTGKYALELKTGTSPTNSQISNGNMTSGTYIKLKAHDSIIGGYPFSNQQDTLIFYYKYVPADPNDTAGINLFFKKNAIMIGGTGMQLSASPSYKRVSMPFNVGSIPDSVYVFMQSSVRWPIPASYNGSDLKIDSMYFKSQSSFTCTLSSSITSHLNVKCNGANSGSATVTASSGTAPYNYTWTPNGGTNATASNLSAGTYTVVVMDKNVCASTSTVSITEPAPLTDSINTICASGPTGTASVITGGGTPAYTYAWTSGSTNATASNLTAGTYTVTVTDANGCITTATANVPICTGVNELGALSNGIVVYPNPVSNLLNITDDFSTDQKHYLALFNEMGKCVRSAELKSGTSTVSLATLPAGMYYYRVTDKNQNNVKSDKIMIIH